MSRHLFNCLDDIESILARGAKVMLFSDFDGTLAPIAAEPALAQLPSETRNLLHILSTELGMRVSIVSGRALSDLREHMGLPELTYSGNHGLEVSGPGIAFVHPGGRSSIADLAVLGRSLAVALAPIEGVLIENKGPTLSVHFRLANPGCFREICDIVEAVIEPLRAQFHVMLGRKVFDVRPNVGWNKGDAIAWIRRAQDGQDAMPIYLGDDTTDEEAFASLPGGITVRVNPAGASRAAYHLEDPVEAGRFLAWLAEVERGRQEHGGTRHALVQGCSHL